ncbi:MAG: NifB/NifX family molybdenum-iron cluster-binding protein [Candidatus Woesearchaeota archaeon]
MKIAVTSENNTIESTVEQRFGRSGFFIVANIENKNITGYEAIENQGSKNAHGAGIRAAEQLGEINADAVITGELGPNAEKILARMGIKAYHSKGDIRKAIDDLISGKLEEISEDANEKAKEKMTSENDSGERIFFPLLEDDGLDSKISEHFGHAPFFGLYDVSKHELKIIKNDLDHSDREKSPIDQIEDAVNPTTIFAKGIGQRAIRIIADKGLCLKTGPYQTIKDVLENLDRLNDQTESCGH